jgi:uncharacterized membrane protein YbhN (UPF0104 family)
MLRGSRFIRRFEKHFLWRAIEGTTAFIDLVLRNPGLTLLALFFGALTLVLSIATLIILCVAIQAPALTVADIGEAAALSLFAGAFPITPGGIGVGEAVFDQLCRWLASGAQDFAYGTGYLAFRVVSLLAACYGFIPLVNLRAMLRANAAAARMAATGESRRTSH